MTLEVGFKYAIIYDDKGKDVVKKVGIVLGIKGNLFDFDTGRTNQEGKPDPEILNTLQVIRAWRVQ